jgi:hypothetical protein
MSLLTPLAAISVFAAFAAGGGCASTTTQKSTIEGTTAQPAAIAHISYQRDQNNNTAVDLRVDHLSAPQKLDPTLTTYVVWVAPMFGGNYEPRGALQVGADRSGEIKFITPLDRFKVVVTAEASPMVAQPRGKIVMQGTVDASLPK